MPPPLARRINATASLHQALVHGFVRAVCGTSCVFRFRDETGDLKIPNAVPFRDALVSLRRDEEVVEVMAQFLFYFEDLDRQLAEGTVLADSVLRASQKRGH